MRTNERNQYLLRIAYTGLMAALCFVGYAVFPAFNATGTKIHLGNAFVVLGALLLGGPCGGIAGAIGLSLADILGGYAASAPRTFICKLLIGLIAGFVAHRIARISQNHPKSYLMRWSAISAAAGLGANCIIEPSIKYLWYTILTPNAEKAESAIHALLAITTYATIINAVINSILGVIVYLAVHPILFRIGFVDVSGAKAVSTKGAA